MEWDKKGRQSQPGEGKRDSFFPRNDNVNNISQDLLTRLELIFYQKAQRDDKTQRLTNCDNYKKKKKDLSQGLQIQSGTKMNN